ncbi:MAG: S41 family peptidase [Candidatus Zixiibacteriota bacterium]
MHARWRYVLNCAAVLGTVFVVAVVFAFGSATAQPMPAGGDDSPKIDAKKQAEIIDSVVAALNEIYVFPETAKKMEQYLRQRHKDKAYNGLATTREFTAQLTEDVREISKDRHLAVIFMPQDDVDYFLNRDSVSEQEQRRILQEEIRRESYSNFDFEKVERMSGNVGYLKFNSFAEAEYAGATAVAALNFLAHCDALIIDLRDNGGGNPSMIQLITSYFFEEPVHLNSFYVRAEDSIHQFWTQSHVQGPRMTDVDLYVLTSSRTFSGAEEFTYNLKNLKRATIVGETTGGGAHPVDRRLFANLNVAMSLPFGRAINPITGTNWEGVGVEPDIKVSREQALDVAYTEALKSLLEKATDEERKQNLRFIMDIKQALRNPAVVGEDILRKYVGVYGPREITYEDGALYYQRKPNPKLKMIPLSENTFCFDQLDYFKLKVNVDADGNPTELMGIYSGGNVDVTPKGEAQ